MNHWIRDIINFVYPPECHICNSPLAPHEKFLCARCINSLPRTGYHRNPRNPMEQRLAGQFPFVAATGHFFYNRDSSLSQLIQDMKYRGFSSIGDFLGELAAKELFTSGFLSDIDYVVPLPMHFLKKARRGFNQTEHIARGICKATGIQFCDALKMTRRRTTQTSLSRSQRLENARHLFAVKKGIEFNGKKVLLVDDVCTTGATISAAAQTLTSQFHQLQLYLFSLGVTF